jgi:hypothetical protein
MLATSKPTLQILLGLFFLAGSGGCGKLSWPNMYKILTNQEPVGQEGDDLYKWLALGFVILLLILKIPVLGTIAKRQMARIEALENPRLFDFYSPLGLLALCTGIPAVKMVETHTDYSYASRIVFSSSGAAVGVLLGACGIFVLYKRFVGSPEGSKPTLSEELLDKSANIV